MICDPDDRKIKMVVRSNMLSSEDLNSIIKLAKQSQDLDGYKFYLPYYIKNLLPEDCDVISNSSFTTVYF